MANYVYVMSDSCAQGQPKYYFTETTGIAFTTVENIEGMLNLLHRCGTENYVPQASFQRQLISVGAERLLDDRAR
jgi:hypothetical protein